MMLVLQLHIRGIRDVFLCAGAFHVAHDFRDSEVVCCCSVTQLCQTLCNSMDRSTPGLPVHHQLLDSLKLMSIELVIPSNHLTLCRPLLLMPSIFPTIRVFSNESALHIQWPKYWSFSFSISPSNEHSGLISFRMDWFDQVVAPRLACLRLKSVCLRGKQNLKLRSRGMGNTDGKFLFKAGLEPPDLEHLTFQVDHLHLLSCLSSANSGASWRLGSVVTWWSF